MAQNKMTKRDWFAVLVGIVEGSEYENKDGVLDFIKNEVALLEKKSGKSGKTKTQKENEVLVEQVYTELIAFDKGMTVTELQASSEFLAQFSNQKLSALLKKLVDAKRVGKTIEGKKSYFLAVVETEGEDEAEEDEFEETEVETEEVEETAEAETEGE